MKVRACPKCGKHNLENAWSCAECGETLSIKALTDTESVQPEPENSKEEVTGNLDPSQIENKKEEAEKKIEEKGPTTLHIFGVSILMVFLIQTLFGPFADWGVGANLTCTAVLFIPAFFGASIGVSVPKSIEGKWFGMWIGAAVGSILMNLITPFMWPGF